MMLLDHPGFLHCQIVQSNNSNYQYPNNSCSVSYACLLLLLYFSMPYMEAFITETFRHSSIATLGGIHSTTETVEFHGYTLPKDTIILSNSWYIHHNKEYWGDPEKFRPERFITSDGKFRPDEALLPFSTGKRVCIGESLARDEMFLFLTGILQQIQFEVDKNGPMPTMERKEAIIVRSRPYKVIMTDRHSST